MATVRAMLGVGIHGCSEKAAKAVMGSHRRARDEAFKDQLYLAYLILFPVCWGIAAAIMYGTTYGWFDK